MSDYNELFAHMEQIGAEADELRERLASAEAKVAKLQEEVEGWMASYAHNDAASLRKFLADEKKIAMLRRRLVIRKRKIAKQDDLIARLRQSMVSSNVALRAQLAGEWRSATEPPTEYGEYQTLSWRPKLQRWANDYHRYSAKGWTHGMYANIPTYYRPIPIPPQEEK